MALLSWTTMGTLLAAGGLFARRPEPGRGAKRRPQRVLNPQRLYGVRADALWAVAGDPHCRTGYRLNARRFLTGDAPDLGASCSAQCHCHYYPVEDRRGRDRRLGGGERRDSLRFSPSGDRRDLQRRDAATVWSHPLRQI